MAMGPLVPLVPNVSGAVVEKACAPLTRPNVSGTVVEKAAAPLTPPNVIRPLVQNASPPMTLPNVAGTVGSLTLSTVNGAVV